MSENQHSHDDTTVTVLSPDGDLTTLHGEGYTLLQAPTGLDSIEIVLGAHPTVIRNPDTVAGVIVSTFGVNPIDGTQVDPMELYQTLSQLPAMFIFSANTPRSTLRIKSVFKDDDKSPITFDTPGTYASNGFGPGFVTVTTILDDADILALESREAPESGGQNYGYTMSEHGPEQVPGSHFIKPTVSSIQIFGIAYRHRVGELMSAMSQAA